MVVLVTDACVLPGPEEVDADEGDGRQAGDGEPDGHTALGALLGASALHSPAVATECDVDAVEVGTQLDQLVPAERRQLLVGVLLVGIHTVGTLAVGVVGVLTTGIAVAHDLAPIHSVAPTTAAIPTTHNAIASVPGPKPASPQPPAALVS